MHTEESIKNFQRHQEYHNNSCGDAYKGWPCDSVADYAVVYGRHADIKEISSTPINSYWTTASNGSEINQILIRHKHANHVNTRLDVQKSPSNW